MLTALVWPVQTLSAKSGSLDALFKTTALQRLNTIDISTSTIGGPATELIGFSAVCPTGFGVGYLIEPDHLMFVISSFKS